MRRLAIVLLVLGAACAPDKPNTPEAKECIKLLEHIVQISPQGQGQDAAKVVDELPSEDLLGCMATDPLTRRCMGAAKSVADIKACPGECVGTLVAFRGEKRKAAKLDDDKPSPEIDARLFPVADKCLAGDAKAADDYKADKDGKRPIDATWK